MKIIVYIISLVVLTLVCLFTYTSHSQAGGPWNDQYCNVEIIKIKIVNQAGEVIENQTEEKVTCDDGAKDFLHGINIFELIVADYDGYNPIVVHRYNEPIISPKWSPDGKSIAYVSFEKKKALLYIYEIYRMK